VPILLCLDGLDEDVTAAVSAGSVLSSAVALGLGPFDGQRIPPFLVVMPWDLKLTAQHVVVLIKKEAKQTQKAREAMPQNQNALT